MLAKTGLHPLIGLRLVNGLGYAPWMSLDFAECDRARMARDPKYDGRFYTGVRTTGIYRRPVCPVRPASKCNKARALKPLSNYSITSSACAST